MRILHVNIRTSIKKKIFQIYLHFCMPSLKQPIPNTRENPPEITEITERLHIIKGACSDHFWDLPSKLWFWYQNKANIFHIIRARFQAKGMLHSEDIQNDSTSLVLRQDYGITSLVHRQDYDITSVPVRYTLRPPESHRSITGATGALPTLTKPYRSTAVVVPLLAPAVQRQTFWACVNISTVVCRC